VRAASAEGDVVVVLGSERVSGGSEGAEKFHVSAMQDLFRNFLTEVVDVC